MNRLKIMDLINYSEELDQEQLKQNPVDEDLTTAIKNLIQRLRDCNPIVAPVGKTEKNSF